jgi:hypothetical protein
MLYEVAPSDVSAGIVLMSASDCKRGDLGKAFVAILESP